MKRDIQQWLCGSALCAGCLTLAGAAGAQQSAQPWYTYQNVPLGGRTAVMGGAGAAFGFDSAMPLLNPAGLARIDDHHISMSATAYSFHAIDVPEFWTYGPDDPKFNDPAVQGPVDSYHSQTFNSFPTSFVYSWPLGEEAGEAGHHVISLSILSPRRYDQELVSKFGVEVAGARIEHLLERSSSLVGYYFGPSYAVQVSSAVRLGVSALALQHQYFVTTANLSQASFGAESQRTIETGAIDGSSWGIVPVVGIQIAATDSFHIGASAQPQSFDIDGTISRVATADQSSSPGFVLDHLAPAEVLSLSSTLSDARFRILTPAQITVGLGYEAPKSFAVAVDVHYYAPLEYDLFEGTSTDTYYDSSVGSSVTRVDDKLTVVGKEVVNVNAGVEVFVSDAVALRFGAFTDMSATPELEPQPDARSLFARRINMYGGSAGLGLFFGPVDFTIGAIYAGGVGNIGASKNLMGGVGQPYQVADATESMLMGIVTGGVSFGQAFAPITDRVKSFEDPDDALRNPERLVTDPEAPHTSPADRPWPPAKPPAPKPQPKPEQPPPGPAPTPPETPPAPPPPETPPAPPPNPGGP